MPRHLGHGMIDAALRRRTFLVAGGVGFCGLDLAAITAANAAKTTRRKPAKSAILIWLSGGASHIDTWDMKPRAPAEFRGTFKPVATSAPGVELCEHLPLLARQAHHLAIVRSLGHFNRGTNDHHAGYYYNLTGHAPDPSFRLLLNNRKPLATDWPYIGSVVGYKRPIHPYLPQLVTLPEKTGFPEYTRPGQLGGRLGLEWDPLYVTAKFERPADFAIPSLEMQGDVSGQRLSSRRQMLSALDGIQRRFDYAGQPAAYTRQQDKVFRLLGSTRLQQACDVSREPPAVRERYGKSLTATCALMGRRLVEAGVPFVTIFSKEDPKLDVLCKSGGSWDTHGNNFNCLRDHLLPEFDRYYSALLDDLHQRGLLDETLVIVNSEMGRTPRIGDPRSGGVGGAGRDHWTHAMSVLLAGGGIRGGQAYGASDRVAAYPHEKPVAPEDIAKTIYHSLGIDNLDAIDREGRPFSLMAEGAPIVELF